MITIFKRSTVLTVLMGLGLCSAALAMPDNLSKMTAVQLKGYLTAQINTKKTAVAKKADLTTFPFTASELITWGKEDLRSGDPNKALVFFDFVLLNLDPKNQVAEFYASLALLGTNQDLDTEFQQLGIMNAQDQITFKKHQSINLPDVISFRPSQALIAEWNSNQLSQAITSLSQINQTFSDTITDPKLGEVKIDYAAVQAILIELNVASYQLHLANAYNTDYAQLTKNDLGELTPNNLSSVTSDVNTLYAQLISNGYITKSGHVTYMSNYLEYPLQPNVLMYFGNALGSNKYVFYSWLGVGSRRVTINPGDCGPQTIYRYNGTVFTTYTPTLDTSTGMCISPVISTPNGPVAGGTDIYTMNLSMTHNGKSYSLTNYHYFPEYTSLSSFLSYTPIDPVLSASNSTAIFNILTNINQDKMTFLGLLNFYPNLLAHKATTPAELTAAKNSLLAMIHSYLNLESYVIAQDQNLGPDYAIGAYTPPANSRKHALTAQAYQKDKLAHQAQQQAIHNLMVAIGNNLTNSAKYPYVQFNDPAFGNINMLASFKFNFAAFFNPNRDVRGYSKLVEQELSVYHLFPSNFSDPTFGGILPGASAADDNFLLKKGAQITSASITTVNGIKSIYLNWVPNWLAKNGQNITGYDLYRSTSSTVNSQSTLVAHLNQNTNSYSDSQIIASTPNYYYRLYTHYRFTDNTTANSYSKVFKVVLNPVIPGKPPVIFQVPDQTMYAGDNLTLNVQGTDLNNLSINWNVAIQTQINSYSDQWGNCTPPKTIVNGVPINCPAGEIYIQFSPSISNTSGVFNAIVYANDTSSGESSMNFTVNVLPTLTGAISGQVIDKATKKAIITAVIVAKGTAQSFSTVTNKQGQYTLNSLQLGKYSISVSYAGYITSSVNVNLTKLNRGIIDNFSLVKK